MEGEFGPVRLTTRNKGDHMRILFKTPHQVFFRRCFFVKSERVIDGNRLKVVHGMFGRKETEIPLDGTVIRRFGIRK